MRARGEEEKEEEEETRREGEDPNEIRNWVSWLMVEKIACCELVGRQAVIKQN